MLRLSLAVSFVAATVYSLHLLGLIRVSYASEWAALGAFGWLSVNVALVWIAIRRIRSLRFATQRRSAVRFAVDLPGSIDGQEASVQDVSVGGTLIATLEPLVEREAHLVSFALPGMTASLWARIRSTRRADSGEYHYALEFEPGQYAARGALARAIFAGRYAVAGTVRTPWPDLLRREIGGLSDRFGQRAPGGAAALPAAVTAAIATPVAAPVASASAGT
jgi:hypothetical protein